MRTCLHGWKRLRYLQRKLHIQALGSRRLTVSAIEQHHVKNRFAHGLESFSPGSDGGHLDIGVKREAICDEFPNVVVVIDVKQLEHQADRGGTWPPS